MTKKSLPTYQLTQQDRALFRAAVDTIRPLPPSTQVAVLPAESVFSQTVEDFWMETVFAETVLSFCRSGVQKRVMQKLQRGQIISQATLDLHGQIVACARKRLLQFIARSSARHYRCVTIIHGKCRQKLTPPLLKNYVNSWLQQHSQVLAFCSALPTDGGRGAVYVLLKSA